MDLKAQEVAELINGVVEGDNNSTINKLSKIERKKPYQVQLFQF